MPPLNLILNGARGGQGTTTVAAALALYAAGHAATQLVTDDMPAAATLLGLPEPDGPEVRVTDYLTLAAEPSGAPTVRIADAPATEPDDGVDGLRLVVLRGPCYIALRSLVLQTGRRADGLILLAEPGRSLTDRDAQDVTGIPVVATVAVTPVVARTIDAGLLVARLHRLADLTPLRRYVTSLLKHIDLPDRPDSSAPRDLNGPRPESPVKIGTDWPVALCATG